MMPMTVQTRAVGELKSWTVAIGLCRSRRMSSEFTSTEFGSDVVQHCEQFETHHAVTGSVARQVGVDPGCCCWVCKEHSRQCPCCGSIKCVQKSP